MPASDEPKESKSLLANPVEADEHRGLREEVARKPSKWIHFGPAYGEDTEVNIRAKDSAWEALLILERGDGDETSYLSSIERIEDRAVAYYKEDVKCPQPSQSFRSMMVKDGCFFLQLALHILGAGALLGHPPSNPYFGADSDSSSYIPAMFFVGNQIPYIVVNALMKQPFFKKIIEKGTWSPQPRDNPVKLALYRTVVEPQLTNIRNYHQPPEHILSALHNLLLGSVKKDDFWKYEMVAFRDPEAADGSSKEDRSFPSVSQLSKLGVRLRKTDNGIAGIRFKNMCLTARLYLPPIILDEHAGQILSNLIDYELLFNEDQRMVTSYLRLITDLIPTYYDFKTLERNGIIEVRSSSLLRRKTIIMLDNLVSPHDTNYTPNILEIRRKIRDYKVVPWRPVSFACSIACGIITFFIAVFTIIQTVFTVLSYYKA